MGKCTLTHFETQSMFARSERLRHPNIKPMISLGIFLMKHRTGYFSFLALTVFGSGGEIRCLLVGFCTGAFLLRSVRVAMKYST